MIKMRILLAGLITFAGLSVYAQDKGAGTPEEKATKMTEKMVEEFSLDAAKSEKLKAINLEYINVKHSLNANDELSKEDKIAKMTEAREARNEALKDILTEEQIAAVNAKEQDRMAKMADFKDRSPEEKAKHKANKLANELELTDEQQQRVEFLILKVNNKIDVIKADTSMTSERKKEFIEGNMKDYKNAMKGILTEEQFSKFEILMAEKQEKREQKKQNLENE